MELEKANEDYMPLIRFWRKLSKSPHKNSKEQLYSFIIHNKIQITEQGDIVLEKGVKQKSNGMPDELVDDRTGTIDHSIGSYVSMPREKVVDNKNITCSSGLHAAPPEYVRNFYSSGILIELVVNPVDVVSVPTDYNSRKVRCCAYRVMGYSPKTARTKQIIKLSEFITNLDNEITYNKKSKEDKSINSTRIEKEIVTLNKENFKVINLGGLSAKAVVALTMDNLGCKLFGGSEPRKAAVLKIAQEKFNEAGWTVSMNENSKPLEEKVEKEILKNKNLKSFDSMTAKQVVQEVMKDLKCEKFGGDIPRKAKVVSQAGKLYENAGWKVKFQIQELL